MASPGTDVTEISGYSLNLANWPMRDPTGWLCFETAENLSPVIPCFLRDIRASQTQRTRTIIPNSGVISVTLGPVNLSVLI